MGDIESSAEESTESKDVESLESGGDESTESKGDESTESKGDATPWPRIRLGAFYLAVLATLGMAVLMMPNELLMGYNAWFMDFGVHQAHDVTLFSLLWIGLMLPMLALLYRSADRVNAVLVPIVFLAPFVAFAALVNSPILMLPVIFGVLSLVVLVLHPAGRSLLEFDVVERVSRPLASLLVVGAVPMLAYAVQQTWLQLGPVDDHILFAHYGAMAVAGLLIALMGTLAVVRRRDWRFAAWTAGLTALVVGVASVSYPAIPSSLGQIGGALLITWAIAFVAGVELTRRDDAGTGLDVEDDVGRPA